MEKDSPYSDWRIFFLKGLLYIGKPLKPSSMLFKKICLSISPNIPGEASKSFGSPLNRNFFISTYLIAFCFCFLIPFILCAIEGTLTGSDKYLRYFRQDGWNIILYVFVCPLYVSLAFGIIRQTISHWGRLVDFADSKANPDINHRRTYRLPIVLFLALLICTGFITNYMYDILHPSTLVAKQARIYWFMTDAGAGIRMLNRVGYYYVVLNFALLFITLLGAACFISLAVEVIRAANASSVEKIDSFAVLQSELVAFTNTYILAKGITAAYALNIIIWAVSPLGNTSNLLVSQIALSIVGVFFVAIPRQYIELKWFELWESSGKDFEYGDTRPWRIRATASLLDAFFVSVILSTWGLDLMSISKWLSNALSI